MIAHLLIVGHLRSGALNPERIVVQNVALWKTVAPNVLHIQKDRSDNTRPLGLYNGAHTEPLQMIQHSKLDPVIVNVGT